MNMSPKEWLIKEFPPKVKNLEGEYGTLFWKQCDYEKVQELSNKIIEMFKEEDMTYTDAYAMLGFVRLDLDYRSERLKL
ncbi:hypothetical protein [Metasolibacillus meyeri]|uniref:hypothetical protein n=1 Tax=Metasolibacillus meyeri TaxID=1071052 RepID=UPI000D30BD1E|nr:hypothetical protein [Metasolibacillus meyeri]